MALARWSPTRLVVAWILAGFVGGLSEPVAARVLSAWTRPEIDQLGLAVRAMLGVLMLGVTYRWYRGWREAGQERVAQALASRRSPW